MSFGTKDFSDLIYKKLEEFEESVILVKPNTNSTFPCREMNTPLKSINKVNQAIEIFQIAITHWHEQLKNAMEMSDQTDEKLSELNLIRISTNPYVYDETLQKYVITSIYEVHYNKITNAFQIIKLGGI